MNRLIVRAGLVSAALVASAAGQITTVSTGSGDWNLPTTWSNGVPGPLDTAVINPGDTVWLATAGVPANPTVAVDQIDVFGTLLSDNTVGQSMTLTLSALNVYPGGTVAAQNGGTAPGGTLRIEPPLAGAPLAIVNDGLIRAGDGVCGGNLLIYGNDPGSDLASANASITSTNGTFLAGESGGQIWIAAGSVTLTDATIRAGDVTPAGPGCGHGGPVGPNVAGSVYLSAITADLLGATTVQGGDNTASSGLGGTVFIRSLNSLFVDVPASVLAGLPGGGGCPGVLTYAAGTSTILGTISPGPGTGCYVWDPPTLIAAGDMSVDADRIIFGGETIDVTGLNAGSAPHFKATTSIEINLSPGGTLDTSGLIPGVPYFSAPLVIIHGEAINSDGVAIDQFIDGQTIYFEARTWRDIGLTPGGTFYGAPGETVRFPVEATNDGAQNENVRLDITDTMGWLAPPVSQTRALGPGFAIFHIAEVAIPGFAAPGQFTDVRARAQTTDGVLLEEAVVTVEVIAAAGVGPCNPADLAQPFGVLDLADVGAFITAFTSGDPSVGDLTGDGLLDLQDIGLFVGSFLSGCP